MKKYNLAPGDFPDISDMQGKLREFDFSKFQAEVYWWRLVELLVEILSN